MNSFPQHPLLLDPRFPPSPESSDLTRVFTILAAHTAKGDIDGVKEDFKHIPLEERDNAVEIILQTFTLAGLPRVMNALAAIKDCLEDVQLASKELNEGSDDYAQRGEELNRQIYGASVSEKLRHNIAMLHPDLDKWMIEIAYGRVLSRPGPSIKDRELCLITVLAGLHSSPQE